MTGIRYPERPSRPDTVVCRAARFDLATPHPSTAVVSARGELDAANGSMFIDFALRHAAEARWLVLDLSGLSFFATAGFSALHTLNVQCVGKDIRWALVPSGAVDRMLKLCDPESKLPVSPDVATALRALRGEAPPQLFELIAEPR